MNQQTIKCDKCGNIISIDEALSAELRLKFESEFGLKMEEEKRKIWAIAQEKAKEKADVELKNLKEDNAEKDKALKEARDEQLKLMREKRTLEEREKNLDFEVAKKVEEERVKFAEAEKKKIEEEMKKKIIEKDLQTEKLLKDSEENARLKMLEKEKQLEQMHRQIEDLKRKSEQGSMQIQGDVQENDLKRLISESFPIDTISDVATGVRGADLLQLVRNSLGANCGKIIWESKNTKAWEDKWLKKLKEDQALSGADICVLVSKALPDGITNFKLIDGVWVCNYASVVGLTFALRSQLIELAQVKGSLVNRDEKMEVLYNYLGSSQFKNRIENIVLAFKGLKDELEKEKRAYTKIWARREKEIERVMNGTVGMYGDLQGIIGAGLPEIKELSMPEEFEEEE
ncbi:MAG: DUF2130 domain-containing protein [Candidatus Gracilibacteria bacterium]|jgi:hypothetical protein|nr:DUF2130 domain-containing protein [Candidatus Gracilibacteria bacterium]